MSKYLYTPYDIALFFECSDFKHGEEKAIRDDLWEKRRAVLPPQDRRDKYRWLRKIEYEQLQFDAIFVPEAESINAALQDIGSRFQLGQADEDSSVSFYQAAANICCYLHRCTAEVADALASIWVSAAQRNLGEQHRTHHGGVKARPTAARL